MKKANIVVLTGMFLLAAVNVFASAGGVPGPDANAKDKAAVKSVIKDGATPDQSADPKATDAIESAKAKINDAAGIPSSEPQGPSVSQ